MSIVDIVIILLVAAVAVFGFFKGFKKSLISLLGFTVSLIVAVLLAKTVATALLSADTIGGWVAGEKSLYSWLYNKLPGSLNSITSMELAEAGANTKALFESETSWFLKLFYPLVSDGLSNSTYYMLPTARHIIALNLAFSIFTLIVGILLFIVMRIIAAVVSLIFKRGMTGKKSVGGRFAGAFIGAVKGTAYCIIILCVFGLISNFGFMKSINKDIEKSDIATHLTTVSQKTTNLMLKSKKTDERHLRLVKIYYKERGLDFDNLEGIEGLFG